MLNLVLFGPPGAGKGTQSEKIIEKYGLTHLSTGDMLRGEIKSGTDLGKEAKNYIDQGKLVPDEVVIGMIRNQIKDNLDSKGFIFDGFPRTTVQAEALDELLKEFDTSITVMIALEVPEEELTKRLLERGKDSGRSDDQDENIIKSRIEEYHKKTAPVADYYSAQDKFHAVNGVGSINDIFDRITSVIEEHSAVL